ncbi:MAG: hypothetical protein ACK5CW_12290 [Verrucomicrobiota bacterium]|jgi:hypothetical protein
MADRENNRIQCETWRNAAFLLAPSGPVADHEVGATVPIAIPLLIKCLASGINGTVSRQSQDEIANLMKAAHGLTAGWVTGLGSEFIMDVT